MNKKLLLFLSMFIFIVGYNHVFSLEPDWIDPPAGMPDCSDQDEPGNTACTATPICNLNGYCGTTSSSYTHDYWSQLNNAFCGSIENNAFLTFTANSSSISFDVYVYNCYDSEAIQIMIFEATNCGSGAVTNFVCVDEMYAQNNAYNVSANGLVPGNDYYIMIDGYGGDVCDYTFVATDGVLTPISAEGLEVSIDNDNFTICAGESVTIEATGGLGSYEWDGDSGLSDDTGDIVTITPPPVPGVYNYSITSSGTIGLCPGFTEYEFTVTIDNCGCIPPVIYVEDLTICEGETVDVWSAIGANSDPDANPTLYASESDANNETNPVTNSEASDSGNYWFRVNDPDEDDCYALHQVTVHKTVIDFDSQKENESCGESNGSLTLNADGGDAPYSYSIDGGNNFSDEETFENLSGGTYNIVIEDDNGCTTTGTITIANIGAPQITVPDDMDICLGESVTLTVGNPENATISWDNDVEDGVPFTPENSGTFSYTVTAENTECSTTEQVTVTVHEQPQVDFSANQNIGCVPLTVVFTNDTDNAGDCFWDFGDGNTSTDCGPVTHTYNQVGEYDVLLHVTTAHGCEDSIIKQNFIEVIEPANAAFTAQPSVVQIPNTTVEFINESSNTNNYLWDFGDGTEFSNENQPAHDFPSDEPGMYEVVLTASNDHCSDTATATIIVEYPNAIYEVPNVFSPNADDENDFFMLIDPENIKTFNVVILNRWGNVVFESNDYQFQWNGKIHNAGADCNEGVYFYKMDFTDHSDKAYKEHGYVHLFR